MDIDNLAREVTRQLEFYSNFVQDEVDVIAKEVSTDTAKRLKQTSPERTGKYATGWKVKKNKGNYIVHNAVAPQLTHLLENGHMNRDGSRTAPVVHIKPVELDGIREFEEKLIRRIEQ